MSCLAPFTSFFKSTKRTGQGAIRGESQRQCPLNVSIHILDDDSLLYVFYLYRPAIFDGDEDDNARVTGGRKWARERWWYQLAQVCRRWRNLILGSASYLRLSLVCTYDTPVADMLAHSPSLPLVIDYDEEDRDITAKDEEGIILALELRNRVRRVRLGMPVPKLQTLVMAIDEEYPVLEYLIMGPWTDDDNTTLVLPETLQAPHLRHLALYGFVLPIGSRLLMTAVGLVTFCLSVSHPSTYFLPGTLLQWISAMPQLETLSIIFEFPVPNRDVERQLIQRPILTSVTLPNLRWFSFKGVSAYVEAVVHGITAPRLEKLDMEFFKQLTFSVPHLQQFMNTAESLRFDSAKFVFSGDGIYVKVYPPEKVAMHALSMNVFCCHLDWQVSSVAQISNSLSQIFSTVTHLTLEYKVYNQSSEEHNGIDRTEWHNLLRSFCNVKTLHVDYGLVKELSRCLRLDNGEPPLDLLPELQGITYSGSGSAGVAFAPFIDARQSAGRPVTLMFSG